MKPADTSAKIRAIKSDVSDQTPDIGDPLTEKAKQELELEAAKQEYCKRTPAEEAQITHSRMHERNERRIERFEVDLAKKDVAIESLSGTVASQNEELGKLRERNDWRKRAEVVFGVMTALGGVGVSVFEKSGGNIAFIFTHGQYFAVCACLALIGGILTAILRLLP